MEPPGQDPLRAQGWGPGQGRQGRVSARSHCLKSASEVRTQALHKKKHIRKVFLYVTYKLKVLFKTSFR